MRLPRASTRRQTEIGSTVRPVGCSISPEPIGAGLEPLEERHAMTVAREQQRRRQSGGASAGDRNGAVRHDRVTPPAPDPPVASAPHEARPAAPRAAGNGRRKPARPFCQVEPFRIAADAAPVAIRRAENFHRVEPAGLGVIGVHVRDHLRLGFDQGFGAGEIGQHVGRRQIDDAASPRPDARS